MTKQKENLFFCNTSLVFFAFLLFSFFKYINLFVRLGRSELPYVCVGFHSVDDQAVSAITNIYIYIFHN